MRGLSAFPRGSQPGLRASGRLAAGPRVGLEPVSCGSEFTPFARNHSFLLVPTPSPSPPHRPSRLGPDVASSTQPPRIPHQITPLLPLQSAVVFYRGHWSTMGPGRGG